MKKAVALVAVLALLTVAYIERRTLFAGLFILQSDGKPPELRTFARDDTTRWLDDYFTAEQLGPGTWAIGEPRYAQNNYNYLIAGDERAVLFDAGPGIRDIRPAVDLLTDLPVTFVPSHFHYDHIGAETRFERIAIVDLPELRNRAPNDLLTPAFGEHVGAAEGFEAPTWKVDEWLPVGEAIELGNRRLVVHYTPGHTTDSVSLYDPAADMLFSGDYLYPGYLYGFLPNSSMGDYLTSAELLLEVVGPDTAIYGAHAVSPLRVPRLGRQHVETLRTGLDDMRDGKLPGTGAYPKEFVFDDDERNPLIMLAEPVWMQDWH